MDLSLTPISDSLGARVTGLTGVDAAKPDVASQIDAALAQHSVVVFPELFISDDDLVSLTRKLGSVVLPPRGSIEGHPEIIRVSRDPDVSIFAELHTANDFFHIDGMSYENPDKATLLTARAAPDPGEGDTEFATTYAAYAELPDDEKAGIQHLRVRHTVASSQRKVFPNPTEKQLAMWNRVAPREHPLVWHRRDGRASLMIGSTAEAVIGLPDDESAALLDRLVTWATQPRFTIRHSWREGDLVIFDNTGLLHRSLPYRARSRRLMHRTTLAGEEAAA